MGQVFSVCVFWFSFSCLAWIFLAFIFSSVIGSTGTLSEALKLSGFPVPLLTAVNSRIEFVEIKRGFFLKKKSNAKTVV